MSRPKAKYRLQGSGWKYTKRIVGLAGDVVALAEQYSNGKWGLHDRNGLALPVIGHHRYETAKDALKSFGATYP